MRILAISLFLVLAPIGLSQIESSRAEVHGPGWNGLELTCDLTPAQQFKNIGSRLDGAGMCVWTSIEMAALYQGLEQMRGFRDWAAANYTGGGWPDRVKPLLEAWWKHKGVAPIPYYQYEGRTPEQVMELLNKTRRMACITYGYSERYGGSISHMVCSPMFAGEYGVVLDNNFVAQKKADGSYNEDIFEWMPKAELVRRMKLTGGSAWVFCWLTPPPPPPAHALRMQSTFNP